MYANSSSTWYIDIGANHHLTSDVSLLNNLQPYTSEEQVMLGNGFFVPIIQSGSGTLPIGGHTLVLSNLLHVPSLNKNLLSVKQFCLDNTITVAFLPNSFGIKDMSMETLILDGGVKDGLCNLPSFSTSVSYHMFHHHRYPVLPTLLYVYLA